MPDCHSWWFSKMLPERKDTLEERCAIKLCFNLEKNATEKYGMLQIFFFFFGASCIYRRSVFEWVRDSRKAGSLWGMMRCVGGVMRSIYQSWLAKRLRLRLLCWGFMGVQEEISSEVASTLQIRSAAFQPGQCTSLQLHPCHRLFDQDGHQISSPPSLSSRHCSLWLFVIP